MKLSVKIKLHVANNLIHVDANTLEMESLKIQLFEAKGKL